MSYQSRSLLKLLDAAALVMARRSSWSKVTETDEFMGVLNALSALPQYLMHAIFVGLVTVSTCKSAIKDMLDCCAQGFLLFN